MLKKVALALLSAMAAGVLYEYTLRGRPLGDADRVVRVGAEGWQITEFNLHATVRRFNAEHPGIRVMLHQLPTGYETSLLFQAGMGDLAYDVLLSGNNYVFEKYRRRGLAEPVDDLLPAPFRERVIPGMLRGCQVGGQTLGVPFMGEAEVLNYRADLFAAAGLTRPPATWEEFERYAERLNHPERNEYAISLNLEQFFFFTQNTYLVLLRSLRGTAVDADGHLDLSSPEAHEVFRMLKRWWVKGLISPACRNPGGAADDFKSGLTAMYVNWQSRGLWAMRNEELADRIGFAPLPRAREVGSLIAVYGGLILRGSKVKAEAGQFLMEALGGYGQRDVIAAGKMPVTADTYRRGEVPEWMIPVGETLGRGYSAPEPMVIIELSDYLCVAFHNYLAAPSDDPAPFLAQAAHQVRERIYKRGR